MKRLIITPFEVNEIKSMQELVAKAVGQAAIKGVSLSMASRKSRRKMGTARQGYTKLILPIAINNLNELPRDIDPAYLQALLVTFDELAILRNHSQKMLEWIDDTMMATGIDAVAITDSMANALHDARKDNEALDTEMGEVDAYNSRFGRQMEDEDTLPDTPATDSGTTNTTK